MRRLLDLLLLISWGTALAQVHDVHCQGDLAPLNIVPTFDHGYLVAYDRDYRIGVFAPDGALLYRTAAKVPNSAWAVIENVSVDSDGVLAAVVRAGGGGGIALFDRNGAQTRYFDTGEFLPTQVAFGPNHAIWALGWLGEDRASLAEDYAILRKFAQDGTALGAFLPRSSFPPDPLHERLIVPFTGFWGLRVAADRVEAVLETAHLWVETDLNGRETGRWKVAPEGRPHAFTQNGDAWRIHETRLERFDRATGVWRVVEFNPPVGNLLGADGNNLVFELPDRTLRWVPAPEEARAANSSTSQTRP